MRRRLPRVGGDRPTRGRRCGRGGVAPPRGRGSTLRQRRCGADRVGSPAWAGIDRHRRRACLPRPRLPRVGGDRPVPVGIVTLTGEAPPRGRGSTPSASVECSSSMGSPAWAGIDRRRSRARHTTARLPRVGGDRPDDAQTGATTAGAPPRGRGSTGDTHDPPRDCRGSPAWAGIDPSSPRRWTASPRLPRVGGDRPVA